MRNRRTIDSRPGELLNIIEHNNEQYWDSLNGIENNVIMLSDMIRKAIRETNGRKAIRDAIRRSSWLVGMESLLLIGNHPDDMETASEIIAALPEYDSEAKTGCVEKIYEYCKTNNMPPEWSIPAVLNIQTKPVEHKFVINPKGIKL